MTQPTTLVLGGGGVAGIAWETGVLAGLADAGVTFDPVTTPTLGTSAGATVAAQFTSGTAIETLYQRQVDGVSYEISKALRGASMIKLLVGMALPGGYESVGRRIGRSALAAKVGSKQERRAIIEARLPNHAWPNGWLGVVVVDAVSGAHRVITRDDGIELVDAVAASCAVPMVWPTVTLDGREYIDGGMRSVLNIDLAPGTGGVLAIGPLTSGFKRVQRVDSQRALLGERPFALITASAESQEAMGKNSLDTSVVPASAAAGRKQGADDAARVAEALGL